MRNFNPFQPGLVLEATPDTAVEFGIACLVPVDCVSYTLGICEGKLAKRR